MKIEWPLLALLIILGFLSFLILKPYLSYIIFAVILVFLTHPLYRKIQIKLRSKSASALILIISLMLIIIIPYVYISTLLFLEARNVFYRLATVELVKLEDLEETLSEKIGIELDIAEKIRTAVVNLGTTVIAYIPKLAMVAANLFIGFTLMFFTMFYLYLDGEKITKRVRELIPLKEKYKDQLFEKTYNLTRALFLGIFLVALVQSLVAGIGYFLFGVPNPIFWGVATALVAIIPILGPPWVYVPLSIYLMYKGSLLAGVALLLYGIVIVSQIDNIVRPKFVRMKTGIDIHPLTIILGVIGGVTLFGMVGFIIGPLILALFLELLSFYRKR